MADEPQQQQDLPSFEEVVERLAKLERKRPRLNDLPLGSLKHYLTENLVPEGDSFLLPKSVGADSLEDGSVTYDKWAAALKGQLRLTVVAAQQPGPLPLNFNYDHNGGLAYVFAAGSGFRGSVGLVGMDIQIAGTIRGQANTFVNEINSHKVFAPTLFDASAWLTADQSYTLDLTAQATTTTDLNDFFTLAVLELPR